MSFERGQSVLWRSRPQEAVGYVIAANVAHDDEDFSALWQPAGAPLRRRRGARGGPRGRGMLPGGWDGSHEDGTWNRPGTLRVHPHGQAWSVLRQWDSALGSYSGWYVNLEQPWRRTPLGFDSGDNVLDVVATDDLSRWWLKDEDELEWSVQVGTIPPEQAAATRAVAAVVGQAIEARAWPFGDEPWGSLAPDPGWSLPAMPPGWAERFEDLEQMGPGTG